MRPLVGADPEVFVRAGGRFVSGHGLIPGTKREPFPVEKGAVQVDGHALEFNIDPARDADEFVYNIEQVKEKLRSMIPQDMTLEISAVAEFEEDYLKSQPEEANMLGCDPDFNAYKGQTNPKPDQHPTMRTAAGHVHIGWTEDVDPYSLDHFHACCTFTKQLDFYLGLPSVILDTDTKRKEMYGKAGCFRPKPYGAEYRVMSNFWLLDKELMRLVYNNTQAAFNALLRGENLGEQYGNLAEEIINSNDKHRAANLCNTIGIPFKPYNWEQFKL
jgi:hypothetical protein